MPGDDLAARVSKWLAETGYPLEMKVSRAIGSALERKPHVRIRRNSYYTDPATGNIREVDLIVAWMKELGHGNFLATMVVECKNTSDPWVVFKHHSGSTLDGLLFDFSHHALRRYSDGEEARGFFAQVELEGLLTEPIPRGSKVSFDGYTVVTAFKDKNGRDSADSAVRQVLSAAANAGLPSKEEVGRHVLYSYTVPVIITTSPLYEAYLGKGDQVQLRLVKYSSIQSPVPGMPELGEVCVSIYTEEALSELIRQCRHMQNSFEELSEDADIDPLLDPEDGGESGSEVVDDIEE